MKKSVSLIMSAFNEEATVSKVLGKVRHLDFIDEMIIVDNGSTDNTYNEILDCQQKDKRIKIYQIEVNKGLGYGIRLAIKKTKGDIVVRQDADLEYDPDELIDLVTQIENGNADVVYGSRSLVNKTHKVHYYYSYVSNFVITHFSNLLTNLMLSDVETAAKAFDGPIVRSLEFKSKGFEIENEMTVKLRKLGCRFYEVPISYYGRSFEEGKKIRARDGLKAIFFTFFHTFIDKGFGIPKIGDVLLFYLLITFLDTNYLLSGFIAYFLSSLLSLLFKTSFEISSESKPTSSFGDYVNQFIAGAALNLLILLLLIENLQIASLPSRIFSIVLSDMLIFSYFTKKYI